MLPTGWPAIWTYGLLALLVVAGAVAAYRLLRRRLILRERTRAEQEAAKLRADAAEAWANYLQSEHEAEKLRAEAAEENARMLGEIDRLKSRLFANISHEFRTPLALLLGPLEDRLHRSMDPDERRDLGLMHRQARRLLRLIDELLDLSRADAGNLTLRARRLDLPAFLREAVFAFTSRAERDRIALRFAPADDTVEVYVDPEKLERIVANLLANAFAFTPSGGTILVGLAGGNADDGPYAELTVRDTGVGIPAEALPHVFDRFYQADTAPLRRHGGSGIGLALVKELVERHGGTIRVESAPGFGSTFFVRFRLGRAHLRPDDLAEDADETPAPNAYAFDDGLDGFFPPPAGEADLDHADPPEDAPRVLVVEDHADVRAYLRRHLGALYRVEEAADGVEGLAQARRERPDLVLVDVMMPRLDGFALCRAIKTDDALADVPVILLTARAEETDRIEGLETGADDYLTKPFSMPELLVRVENLIELRRALRERFSEELIFAPSGVAVPSAETAFLEEVRRAIEAELGNSAFTVEQLAEAVAVSTRQLYRKVKALTTLSPGGLIRLMRLHRAVQLLEQPAGTVAEVAFAVGFNDADHFSQLFRQTYGQTPSAYRRACEG